MFVTGPILYSLVAAGHCVIACNNSILAGAVTPVHALHWLLGLQVAVAFTIQ